MPVLIVFFILLVIVATVYVLLYLYNFFAKRRAAANTGAPAPGGEYYQYCGSEIDMAAHTIDAILARHFPYYTNLSAALQPLFIQRLQQFLGIKTFITPHGETYKELPVLLSAAATQLTFGLDDFELTWFKYIHVHPAEYFADDPNALRVLAGHVEGQTITVAWNHFYKGIRDEKDGANVGLHELAHALYYQHVVVHNGEKKLFIEELGEVMEEGEEIYMLRHTYKVLYSDYAYKNLQEFWAESIELFFERPIEMQQHYPDLFNTLKDLLNQDPLNKTNPLLAG